MTHWTFVNNVSFYSVLRDVASSSRAVIGCSWRFGPLIISAPPGCSAAATELHRQTGRYCFPRNKHTPTGSKQLLTQRHHPGKRQPEYDSCLFFDLCGETSSWRPATGDTLHPQRGPTADLLTHEDVATLSAMQLSRLHSSTQAPVTARVLLRRTSSRRLLPSPQEGAAPAAIERRPSLIPTIPEVIAPERRGQFRRRNVMSLSDAYSVCLICHNDLSQGTGGTTELQCTHTFHKECIEEWLWRKQSCPTCHVQVSVPQPTYWSSTRVKVP
ncbi:uncharacterized protein LOC131963149 isoform X1 [Centropristis striata]|uniref:uncharacterized protein LOC131963149 isoform X1 n=1 Tax=Centropristis striata TaxID=184440 RepID=UPI0027E18CDC|nr:uncharacterized protein LOC131963149 isoform X1 [Centropristis striata]